MDKSTPEINRNPQTLAENAKCAQEGGNVAAVARKELESKTGKSVVTPLNASTFFTLEGKQAEKIPDEEK